MAEIDLGGGEKVGRERCTDTGKGKSTSSFKKNNLKIQAKPHRGRAVPVTGGGTEAQLPCLSFHCQVVFRSPGQGTSAIPSTLEF